jgi:hypothetical protein
MHSRTLLRLIVTAPAVFPLHRVRAQTRTGGAGPSTDLTPEAVALLHQIGATVLPRSLGDVRIRSLVDGFVAWTRGWREGVALAHGYGHPRLRKSGPSPARQYIDQLSGIARAATAKGGRFDALDLDTRRAVLDDSLAAAGVKTLPPRPMGVHVVSDLMAFYFRSSEANDDCYRARIQREVCRPIAVTVRKPEPKR